MMSRLFSAAAAAPRVFASPLAKKIARETGVDLTALAGKGSGPGGRILRGDVSAFGVPGAAPKAVAAAVTAPATPSTVSTAPAPVQAFAAPTGNYADTSVSGLSASIASRLAYSKQTVPHYTLTAEINLDAALALRAKLNGKQKEDAQISLNDFFVKASALALQKVPEVNSSWLGDVIRTYDYVDISVNVASKDGTVAPVVRDADAKGLSAISSSVKKLSQAAADGTLTPADVEGGTFTIINLGAYGVKQFSAIITPPQAAVLAIGTVSKRVIPNPDATSEVVFATSTQVSVTLSCDHRVVDGAVGATWLAAFKDLLQSPESMLL